MDIEVEFSFEVVGAKFAETDRENRLEKQYQSCGASSEEGNSLSFIPSYNG